ncbi:hypothetical protein GCM10009555_017870 [Acrocarpospora macrocephala]|uniref:Uncharacterized protein n=1 Tax=Acrocarpospora macrocephala TaxID=150177 RepID=A0A5M3WEF3_9ACTN|nr:hypothetical protein [Acrocarpospora macrocephala]GES07447.1 hypothetical protein Amac_010420 [Acrocarpospora macrocephala]
MTTTTITIWRCDHAGCCTTAPKLTPGWADAIYTHGCPEHAEEIRAHRADLDGKLSGRGRKEHTWWTLVCACGWTPPNMPAIGVKDGYFQLQAAHLAHVAARTLVTVAEGREP